MFNLEQNAPNEDKLSSWTLLTEKMTPMLKHKVL